MQLFPRFFRDPATHASSAMMPLGQSDRIVIIDSLRGVAVLGILLMNIAVFAMPSADGYNLNVRNEFGTVNYYTWWIVNGGFEGTMRAIFSMLFGAGCLLLLERLEKKNGAVSAADIYYRRIIWLLLFGLINAFIFLWLGDILYAYALCGFFLFPFRRLSPARLLAIGLFIMAIGMYKNTSRHYETRAMRTKGEQVLALLKKDSTVALTDEQKEAKTKWEGFAERQKIENIRKESDKQVKKMQKGYFALLSDLKEVNMRIQSSTFYNYYFWDITCLLFIGMALFKWGVFTAERSKKFYWRLLLAGYGVGLPLNYYFLWSNISSHFDPSLLANNMLFDIYDLKRLFTALGHVGLVMLLYKYGRLTWLWNVLAKVGQMAFTNYLMQSIFCAILFDGFGFKLYGQLQRYETYYVVGGIWLFQIITSPIWLHYFYFGPFEWVWRSLTYWKKQPMRRPAGSGVNASFA